MFAYVIIGKAAIAFLNRKGEILLQCRKGFQQQRVELIQTRLDGILTIAVIATMDNVELCIS